MLLHSLDELNSDKADLAECRALLSCGSKTFFAASFLLPIRVRDPATALYAFCRLADDVVDEGIGGDAALDHLRDRLAKAYAGNPFPIAADRAFSATVLKFGVPRELPEALIEGFEWDATGRRYETISDLQGYAARVAGTVGVMMALLMGVRGTDDLARACDLGAAMQLSNIARDVGEDARNGRLYLPAEWLREVGIDPDQFMANPQFSPALGSVVQRLLDLADELYLRAEAGIARLPSDCRSGIYAARKLYCEIGRQVERNKLDSVSQRAFVAKSRKLQLLALSLAHTVRVDRDYAGLVMSEAKFLVDAAATCDAPNTVWATPEPGLPPWWNIAGRAAHVIEIFDRLERTERSERFQRFEPGRENALRST
jgi:15-cis-phytoene synthase